jgi:hypothetical protein
LVSYRAGVTGMNGIISGYFPLRMEMLLGFMSVRGRLAVRCWRRHHDS